MLSKDNFTEAHIRDLQAASGRDPSLIERAVFAFGLLEAMARSGLEFTFKGGTCLMLLLERPMRLSTDVDVVVAPGVDVRPYVDEASHIFPFVDVEEDVRRGRNGIVKRHFRFSYASPTTGKELTTLLDVLFDDDHYADATMRPIANELLLQVGDPVLVRVPGVDGILGDKLTAFAPRTVGIPLGQRKDMEVAKQFYDVSTLIGAAGDFRAVAETYGRVCDAEIGYRGGGMGREDCLLDTVGTALCIASRGKARPEDWPAMLGGMRALHGHVFAENFSPELAARRAPRVACLAASILAGEEFRLLGKEEVAVLKAEQLEGDAFRPLKYLRKVDAEGFAYAVKAERLLKAAGAGL